MSEKINEEIIKTVRDEIKNKYIVFRQGSSLVGIDLIYVKNVIIIQDVKINQLPGNAMSCGVATIRNEPIGLVNFNKWLGFKEEDENLLILNCDIDGEKLGILTADVVGIIEVEENDYRPGQHEKVRCLTYTEVNGSKDLVTIFDYKKMVNDIKNTK